MNSRSCKKLTLIGYFGLTLLNANVALIPQPALAVDTITANSSFFELPDLDISPLHWLKTQYVKYASYRFLDKAYRYVNDQDDQHAQQELEKYLALYPQHEQAGITYINVLYRLKEYTKLLSYTKPNTINQTNYHFVLYQTLAKSKLGHFDESLNGYHKLSQSDDATQQEKIHLLTTILSDCFQVEDCAVAKPILLQLHELNETYFNTYQLARVYEKENNLALAAKLYKQADQLATKNEQHYLSLISLAEIKNKQIQFDAAIKSFELALNYTQDKNYVYTALTNTTYRQSQYKKAIKWAKALLANKKSHDVQKMLANSLFRTGKLNQSIREFKETLKSPINREEAFNINMTIGYAYSRLNQSDHAIHYFSNANDIYTRVSSLQALGRALIKTNQNIEAIAVYEKLIKIKKPTSKTYGLVYQELGVLYLIEHRVLDAIKPLHIAIEHGIDDFEIRKSLAMTYFQTRQYDKARIEFHLALKHQHDYQTMVHLGRTYAKLRDYGLATFYLESAIKAISDHEEKMVLANELAQLHHLLENYYEAFNYYRDVTLYQKTQQKSTFSVLNLKLARASRLNENDLQALNYIDQINPDDLNIGEQSMYVSEVIQLSDLTFNPAIGIAKLSQLDNTALDDQSLEIIADFYYRMGNTKHQIAVLEELVDRDIYDMEYKTSLAYAYKTAGEQEQAKALFEEVVNNTSDHPLAYEELAYLSLKNHHREEALSWFEQALTSRETYGKNSNNNRAHLLSIKQELTRLTRNTRIIAYQSFANQSIISDETHSGFSGGSLSLFHRPKLFGLFSNRVFEFYGQANWNSSTDSSYGALFAPFRLGLQYQLLKSYDLYAKLERKISDTTEIPDGWAAKIAFSWQKKYQYQTRNLWYFSSLYGEVEKVIDKVVGAQLAVLNVRQGLQLKSGVKGMITPFLVFSASRYNKKESHIYYSEGGLGIAYHNTFNQNSYAIDKSHFELNLQVTRGLFNIESRWSTSLVINY